MPDDPTPTRGGKLVYGLEAESDSFCLPDAQLAISGMQVLRAFYDPLVVPNAKGGYSPYLAKGLESSPDHRVWTITLRPGIKFTDGTPLDSAIVRDNLLAYMDSVLFSVVYEPVKSVEAVNELTVKVTLDQPWVTFPAALYGGGRVGIIGRAQLEGRGTRKGQPIAPGEQDDCTTNLVGTGPFKFVSWARGRNLQGVRNDHYWQKAPDGKPYPYLAAIEFRPIANTGSRVVDLQQGELNMMQTSTMRDMEGALAQLKDSGDINLMISEEHTETSYLIINVKSDKAPILAKVEARRAIAQAIDRSKLNEVENHGFATPADGPFAPGTLGYLEDPGRPEFDLDAAKDAVRKLKASGQSVKVRYLVDAEASSVVRADLVRQMLNAAGFQVEVVTVDQVELINKVIAGDYDIADFRNQPSEDPDTNYHWWYGGTILNFGRFDDDVINRSLRIGRTESDTAKRRQAYETLNRQFAKQAYNVYLWYAPWAVAESPDVHGILGPPLPDEPDADPPTRLVTGHPLLGIWIDHD